MVTARSAWALIGVETVALLLPAVGSKKPDGTAAEAVLLTEPVAAARTGAVTVKVATAPLLRLIALLTRLPVPLAAPQLPVPVIAHVQLIEPIGPSLVVSNVSLTSAPVTLAGPLLVIVIV